MREPLAAWLCAILPVLAAGAVHAELTVETARYLCERGVEIPVTYASDTPYTYRGIAVLNIEGRQVTLYHEDADYAAIFSWPSDGSGYRWIVSADSAILMWSDPEAGAQPPLLEKCKRQ